MSLTPAVYLPPVSMTLVANDVNKQVSKQNNQNFSDLRFFPCATGVNDTGGAPGAVNISANKKKLNDPNGIHRGLGETDS